MGVTTEGYVYFIKEFHSNTYKIGKTKNIKNRLSVFNVKLPFKWEMVHIIKTKDYSQVEKDAHNFFKQKRVNGEWFALEEGDLNLIKQDDFIKIINPRKKESKKTGNKPSANPYEQLLELSQKNLDGMKEISERFEKYDKFLRMRLEKTLSLEDELSRESQEVYQQLLQIAATHEEEKKKGFFARLFGK